MIADTETRLDANHKMNCAKDEELLLLRDLRISNTREIEELNVANNQLEAHKSTSSEEIIRLKSVVESQKGKRCKQVMYILT